MHAYGQCPHNRAQFFPNQNSPNVENSNQNNAPASPNPSAQPSAGNVNNANSNNNNANHNNDRRANAQSTYAPPARRNLPSFCYAPKQVQNDSGLDPNKLYLDNCGTHHSTGDLSKMVNYRQFEQPAEMVSINGGQAIGSGNLKVISQVDGEAIELELTDVLYIPGSPCTIVSQLRFEDRGCSVDWKTNKTFNCTRIMFEGETIVLAKRKINSATMQLYETTMVFAPSYSFMTMGEAHRLIGHANDQKILETSKVVTGLSVDPGRCSPECETCALTKGRRRTFNHQLLTETVPGMSLHTDINHLPVESIGKKKFAVVFVCEATRYRRVYFTRNQEASELLIAFQQCYADQSYDLGYYPKRMHSDKGTNYLSETIQKFLLGNGTKPTNSSPENHQQNGLAERVHQDLTNMTAALDRKSVV